MTSSYLPVSFINLHVWISQACMFIGIGGGGWSAALHRSQVWTKNMGNTCILWLLTLADSQAAPYTLMCYVTCMTRSGLQSDILNGCFSLLDRPRYWTINTFFWHNRLMLCCQFFLCFSLLCGFWWLHFVKLTCWPKWAETFLLPWWVSFKLTSATKLSSTVHYWVGT